MYGLGTKLMVGIASFFIIVGAAFIAFYFWPKPPAEVPTKTEIETEVSQAPPAVIEEEPSPNAETPPEESPPPPPQIPTPPPPPSIIGPPPSQVPAAINETDMPLTIPDGFRVSLFNSVSLGPIRFMAFSPDGILFISLPSAAGLYSPNTSGGKILALPDANKDGKADEAKTVISGLSNRPHGLAFYNSYLYVAEENRVLRYPYRGNGNVGAREVIVDGLPAGDGHVSRTIGFSSMGKMYVSVGSSCNICEEQDERRATILEFNPDGSGQRIFARGLRNAVGFVFHPSSDEIWATENGRDRLGDNLPPDEINIVRDGQHYGWPYCYGKRVADPEFNNASFCPTSQESTHNMQAHSAPLGLRFIQSEQFPKTWQGDLLVAYHGSWNRSIPTGYKVVRLVVEANGITSEHDFISGWLRPDFSTVGRPVDLVFDSDGALYISDDKTGFIYRVTEIQDN